MLVSGSASAQVPGELRGRIIDAQSARPISGARIELVGRVEYALSHVDGSFVLRGIEPGDVTIRVRALGHAPRDTSVAIANGRSAVVEMALQTVASRLDPILVRSSRDSSSAVVLDRRAIEQSGRRDVGELLLNVPGVVVTQSGGPGSPSRVSIRGSSANEVLVVVDGTPINSPITGEADLSRIGIESLERVAVLPGAQSARYGSRALAGVVIIETRRAEDASAAAAFGAWGERNLSASAGGTRLHNSVNTAASLTGDYRETKGDFSYEVPLLRGGGRARRVNGDARAVGLLATTSLDAERGGARVSAEWQTRSRGMPGSIVQPSTTGRQHDSRVAGGADGRWNAGSITTAINLDAARERATFVDPSPPFGSVYDDAVDANTLSLSVASTATTNVGTATAGVDTRTIGVTSTMLAANAPHRQHQAGVWLTTRAYREVGNDVDVAIDASARVDQDSYLRHAVVSPRVGLTASRAVASLSVFYGGAYAPPSLADQFFHEGVLVRPNQDLQPERVRDELEVRGSLRDVDLGVARVGVEAAAYRANVRGMILWQPNFQFIWSPSNFDVSRSGWDLNGHASIPRIGVDASASFSRTDVRYAGSVLQGQVAYRPRSTANASLSATHWSTRLEASTRYIGARRTVIGSALNSLEPYTLTDVRVSRAIARHGWHMDATVGVENVFDRAASMLVDYPFPGRSWTVSLRTRRSDAAASRTSSTP